MIKKCLFLFLAFYAFFSVSAQELSDEKIIRLVADNVLKNTSFSFKNKKSGEKYKTLKGLDYSPDIVVENPYNTWEYWNGVLNVAMVKMAESLNEPKYSDYSKTNFEFIFDNLPFFEKQYKNNVRYSSWHQYFRMDKLDDCGAMAAGLAEVYSLDNQDRYKAYLDRAANYILKEQAVLSDNTLCRPVPRRWTIWADDLYMSIPFLARMGQLTKDPRYFDFAVVQVKNYYKYLFNNYTGLYYHCWYSDVKLNGVAHWGRCNGWVMMATAELLTYLPKTHPEFDSVVALLLNHITGVSRYQDISGMWHQLLNKPDSYLESSCTAMFVYSIAKVVNMGLINESYLSIAENGWEGLKTKINENGEVADICIGTGIREDIKFYYTRPAKLNDIHGLGAILLAGNEIIISRNNQLK